MSLCPQAAGSLGTARCHRWGLLWGGFPGGGPAPSGWRRDGEAPSQGTGWVRRSPQSDSAGREVVIGCGVSAHRLVPPPGQGMPMRPAVPCLRPPSRPPVSHHCLCEEELCLRVTLGATKPLPAGLPLPLGHRATLTGSSFLFHCQRSTGLPGSSPLPWHPRLPCRTPNRGNAAHAVGRGPPSPLEGLLGGGCPGTFLSLSAPSGAGAQSCFGGLHTHPWQEGSRGLAPHSWVALPGPPPPGRGEGLCCTVVLPVLMRASIVFISGIFLRERGQW